MEKQPMVISDRPGRCERHLLRKRDNPLFPERERSFNAAQLLEAQRLDHEELVAFITEFRKLVYKAAHLQANEESEVILGLKEELDKAYEQAAGLADDQSETKDAITKLVAIIMAAVRKGAGNDAVALAELEQETLARSTHYELLEHALVADLLHPDSPIKPKELAPTLLSATAEELAAVLSIFDDAQIQLLHEDAEKLLAQTADAPQSAQQRLAEIRQWLEKPDPTP